MTATSTIPESVSPGRMACSAPGTPGKRKRTDTRADAVSAQRRELPWVKVQKEYVFDTSEGKKTLADLFDGRSQLIVYHFMWRKEFGEGCVGCSYLCDHVDGMRQHLVQHDVNWVAISRAPLADLEGFKQRMGWKFPWLSSYYTTSTSTITSPSRRRNSSPARSTTTIAGRTPRSRSSPA